MRWTCQRPSLRWQSAVKLYENAIAATDDKAALVSRTYEMIDRVTRYLDIKLTEFGNELDRCAAQNALSIWYLVGSYAHLSRGAPTLVLRPSVATLLTKTHRCLRCSSSPGITRTLRDKSLALDAPERPEYEPESLAQPVAAAAPVVAAPAARHRSTGQSARSSRGGSAAPKKRKRDPQPAKVRSLAPLLLLPPSPTHTYPLSPDTRTHASSRCFFGSSSTVPLNSAQPLPKLTLAVAARSFQAAALPVAPPPLSTDGDLGAIPIVAPGPAMTAEQARLAGEPLWCFCQQVSYGEMVACDDERVSLHATIPLSHRENSCPLAPHSVCVYLLRRDCVHRASHPPHPCALISPRSAPSSGSTTHASA